MTNYNPPGRPILTNHLGRNPFGVVCRLAIPFILAAALGTWDRPARGREWVVDLNHPHCDDRGPATASHPLRSINRAAQLAQPGDTVVVRAGIYRERVAPARGGLKSRPIVYQAAGNAQVVIKGSDVWRPKWQRQQSALPVYRGALDEDLFQGAGIHPYRTQLKSAPAGQRLTLGQIFVDGIPLREVESHRDLLRTPSSWLVNAEGTTIHVHFSDDKVSPTERLVELTVRDRIFAPHRRGLGYIHVQGFVMEHCANQFPDRFWQSDSPQAGALGCRAGHHWVIEHNTIRHAKSIGIDCGFEGKFDLEGRQPTPQNSGYHIIRNNVVSDNGCCGIAGMRSHFTRIVDNIIQRNNVLEHSAPEIGGIKVHHFIGGRIEGNLIHNNLAHGIWIDNVYRQSRVTRNLVVSNHGNGIFVELGEGPLLVDNNVVADTRRGFHPRDPRGDGLYSHDASGITFAHNLVIGSHRFGAFHLMVSKRPRAGVSNIQLLNNVFVDNAQGNINLPLRSPVSVRNHSDHNLFAGHDMFLINPWGGVPKSQLLKTVAQTVSRPLDRWKNAAPRLKLAEWQRVTGWDLLSAEFTMKVDRLTPDFVLRLRAPMDPSAVSAFPIPSVDRDFFGRQIPTQAARVGPFQDLELGTNEWKLWPRLSSNSQ